MAGATLQERRRLAEYMRDRLRGVLMKPAGGVGAGSADSKGVCWILPFHQAALHRTATINIIIERMVSTLSSLT